MSIEKYILSSYPTVTPYVGVNAIEELLLGERYLVVMENDGFVGILTSYDLIKRPHKIVIDCLSPKEKLSTVDSIVYAFEKLNANKSSALPVFEENNFVGIIDRDFLIEKLKFEIQDLYDQSKISYKLKDSFLSYLSHEIRTPLNSILGFIEIISNLETDELVDQVYLNIIKENSERFLLTMDDLITFARVNSGEKINIEKSNLNIKELFIGLKTTLETKIYTSEGLNICIDYEINDSQLIIHSDKRKLNQILYHLALTLVYHFSCIHILLSYINKENTIVILIKGNDAIINKKKKEIMTSILDEERDLNSFKKLDIGIIELFTVNRLVSLFNGTINLLAKENKIMFKLTIPLTIEEKYSYSIPL
jgi:signal transduction histidine kinase